MLFDKILVFLGLTYLFAPILVFFNTFLNLWGILFSIIFVYFFYKLYLSLIRKEIDLFNKKDIVYCIIAVILIMAWVFLSGIGGFAYQNDDFWARNAIYRDLINYDWPIIYDLSLEPDYVVNLLGTDKVAFSYYYIFWLPIALISKIFNLSWFISNLLLYFYVVLGLLLVLYFLNRKLNKCSYIALILLILFSGLDIVRFVIRNNYLPIIEHIEWYGDFFYQYSSNTTQLFWIFNQSVPIWLLMSILLNIDDYKYSIGLCALAFAYSPWAMFGLLPYMFYILIKDIKGSINFENVSISLLMLIIFGTFYFCGQKGTNAFHISFMYFHNSYKAYLMLMLLEVIIYFLLIGKNKYEYYYVTLFSLLLIPYVQDESLNFCMRASIPALFMLMYYAIRSLCDNNKMLKNVTLIVLIIGAYTPFTEIYRSIDNTLNWHEYIIRDEIYSFGDTHYNGDDREDSIKMISDQFFAYDYQDSFFFKYLAKKG